MSGSRAGEECWIQRFPCIIGRSAEANISLAEAGIWDRHLELELDPARSFSLRTFPNALATINGHSLAHVTLRNGDLIELGAVRLQFWLKETEQRSIRFREALTWAGIAMISAAQIGLIFWLVT
ncbi:MAG: FHA domain-containing protein [Verrucomicrobiales bacterium]|nr:FHA domain-containing protein [Verrucomicrobiales bacterium]